MNYIGLLTPWLAFGQIWSFWAIFVGWKWGKPGNGLRAKMQGNQPEFSDPQHKDAKLCSYSGKQQVSI